MNVICPSCKKSITRADYAESGHMRGKVHTDKESEFYLPKAERKRISSEMCPVVIGTGTLSRQTSNWQEERKLTRDLGIS